MKTLIIGGSGLFGLNWALKQYQKNQIILALHHKHVDFDGVTSINIDYNNYNILCYLLYSTYYVQKRSLYISTAF